MLPTEATSRAIIAELHKSAKPWWFVYYITLIAFISCIGIGSVRLHWGWLITAGVLFLITLIVGYFAAVLSLAKDYFTEEVETNATRFYSVLIGAIACAAAYGILETQFAPAPGSAVGALQTVAKAVASFIGSIGFAGVFAAFCAELTGGRKYPFSITPVEYFVQHVVLKEKRDNLVKTIYFLNSRGKLDKLSVELTSNNGLLSETIMLAVQVKEGDKIQVIESRHHRFIVKVIPARVASEEETPAS